MYISQYTWDKIPKEKKEKIILPTSTFPSKHRIITCSWHWGFPRDFAVHKGHIPCIVCSLSSNLAVEGRSWRQDNGDATGPCIPVSSGDKDASESEDLLETRRLVLMSHFIFVQLLTPLHLSKTAPDFTACACAQVTVPVRIYALDSAYAFITYVDSHQLIPQIRFILQSVSKEVWGMCCNPK